MYLQTQTQHWLDPSRGSIEGGIAENIQYLPLVEKKPVREGSNERSELLNLLRGQRVQLPDLHKIFEGWPEAINDHVDALRIVVGADLDKLLSPGKRRSKLKASDFGLFASMWWPYASLERLCIAVYVGIWLFAWDDEMDSTEFSELAIDFQEAQAFRAKTANFCRASLELDSKTPCQGTDGPQTAVRSSIIEEFAPVGHAMVKAYTLDQRQILMREIDRFVETCGLEQLAELGEELPSVETYNYLRMGTSAVPICLALHEYTLNIRLPPHVMQSSMMQMLWDQTNIIISVANDILSVKKEIAQNQVGTLIPLLFVAHNYNLQAAMDHATEMLRKAAADFDLAANGLLAEFSHDEKITVDLQKYIQSFRYACSGNLIWSLRSGRYGLQDLDLRGGATLQI